LKIYPKVHLETQETANNQGNTQQKEQCRRYHNTRLQTILQNNSTCKEHGSCIKQTWTPVEQNRAPGYESTQLSPPYFWQRCQKYMMEKWYPFQQMLLGKVVICMQETETRSMFITL
jgi:hypothetical protein